jgi:Tol biopolymer transport system component/DNA-binding winged helix-turn-helix (wHTH) protein
MNRSCYAFGDFCLDVSDRQLLHSGAPVPLPPKVFDTLLILVEKPGHLIDKDEFMQKLWPGIFVGEDALARNISVLRKSLGDGSDCQELIVTVPKRGYRFTVAVRQVSTVEQAEDQTAAAAEARGTFGRIGKDSFDFLYSWRSRAALLILVLAVGSIAGYVTFRLLSPPRILRVVRSTQLTTSAKVDPWARLVSDGSRIYFLERAGDHWNLMQTSVSGGEPQIVAAPFRNTVVLDVSPDHANLLIATFTSRGDRMPLWTWPVQGGAPKRVGEVMVYSAVWCPNNRQIIFGMDDGIYQVDVEGTNAHKFAATDGTPGEFSWSPDGRVLRFTVYSQRGFNWAIWEIRPDGTHPHRLLPGWNNPPEESRGSWSPDGKYFLFQSHHAKATDIWAIREERPLFPRHPAEPVRLTGGPVDISTPLVSGDGHRVFAIGERGRNEFVRYDFQSHQFLPAFTDIQGEWLDFSWDREWIAFGSTGQRTFGRMKSDGSQRLNLTTPGIRGYAPRWSPDGRLLAYTGLTSGGLIKIFLISAEGGSPKELFPEDRNQDDPSWSPDGKFIAFVRADPPPASGGLSFQIYLLDLSTNQISLIPGPGGMRSPTWSPDGRFIAAKTEDLHQLMLLNIRTQQWTKLCEGTLVNVMAWSKDGKALYYQDLLEANEPVYRVRLSDHKRELVTSFETLLAGSTQRAAFVTLAPDGSLIATLTRAGGDIYSLDLDLP